MAKNTRRDDSTTKAQTEAAMWPEAFGPVREQDTAKGGPTVVSTKAFLKAFKTS